MTPALIDTGPLVAILSPTDRYHAVCVAQLDTLATPLVTCWAVIAEAAYLLRRRPAAVQRLLTSIAEGWLTLPPFPADSGRWLAAYMKRYQDTGVQLADASLIWLAETQQIDTVFSLDQRDFAIYRTGAGRTLTRLPDLGDR